MIMLALLSGLLVVTISAWLLTETLKGGRKRLWLAVAIPVLFAYPFGLLVYGTGLLGYATDAHLPADFRLISSVADEKQQTVFALVMPKGSAEPRFFKVTDDFEQNRKAFAQAQSGTDRGLPMAGKPGKKGKPSSGSESEGAYEFYQLPPGNLPAKDPQ